MTSGLLGIADGRALGTSVRLAVTRRDRLAAAKGALYQVLSDIDLAASRFRADSELSRLNAQPEREVRVSALLARLIAEALRGAAVTGGAVDPTVGTAVRLAGYDVDFASVPAVGAPVIIAIQRVPGWQAVQFLPSAATVRVPRGVELDLGATAKALAADLGASAALRAAGEGGVIVSLGGDIAVAGDAPAGGWGVHVSENSGTKVRRRLPSRPVAWPRRARR